VVGVLVLGAGDATGAGELAIGAAGELAAVDASSLAAASDPVGPASVVVAASGLAGVGITLACLVDIEHAATAARVATVATASVMPVRQVRRAIPHADTTGAPFRRNCEAGRSGGYVTLHA
jgi:hypothetical protein